MLTVLIAVSVAKCPSGCKRFNCLATSSRYLATFEPSTVVNSSATYCNEIKGTYQPKFTPYYKITVSCSGKSPSGVDYENEFRLHSPKEELHPPSSFSSGLTGSSPQRDEKIERMVASFENQYCSRLHLGLNHSDLNFPDSGEGASGLSQSWRRRFTGLACTTNKTLSFVAVDSILYPAVAERLGLDVFNETHATISAIVEPANDNVYVLNHALAAAAIGVESATINKRAIYEFIKNYTAGTLPRFVRRATSTSSSEQCLTQTDGVTNIICVPEITADSFKSVVLNKSKDAVLFYYTPWCGLCTGVAHVYLTIARFFSTADDIVFARYSVEVTPM